MESSLLVDLKRGTEFKQPAKTGGSTAQSDAAHSFDAFAADDQADREPKPHFLPKATWPAMKTSGANTVQNQQLTAPMNESYLMVVARVRDLLQEEHDDEAGTAPPTSHAYELAVRVLTDAYRQMRGTFPRASASTDEKGTIYLYWTRPGRNVHLIVPGDEKEPDSIFYRDGTTHRLEECSSPGSLSEALAHRLEWFASA